MARPSSGGPRDRGSPSATAPGQLRGWRRARAGECQTASRPASARFRARREDVGEARSVSPAAGSAHALDQPRGGNVRAAATHGHLLAQDGPHRARRSQHPGPGDAQPGARHHRGGRAAGSERSARAMRAGSAARSSMRRAVAGDVGRGCAGAAPQRGARAALSSSSGRFYPDDRVAFARWLTVRRYPRSSCVSHARDGAVTEEVEHMVPVVGRPGGRAGGDDLAGLPRRHRRAATYRRQVPRRPAVRLPGTRR